MKVFNVFVEFHFIYQKLHILTVNSNFCRFTAEHRIHWEKHAESLYFSIYLTVKISKFCRL